MSPFATALFYTLAALCFVLAVWSTKGRRWEHAAGLIPLGLLAWLLPALWAAWRLAWRAR